MKFILEKNYGEFKQLRVGTGPITVQGRIIRFPELPVNKTFGFFLHQNKVTGTWFVTEITTGQQVGAGKTQKRAVEAFSSNLDRWGVDTMVKLIQENPKI